MITQCKILILSSFLLSMLSTTGCAVVTGGDDNVTSSTSIKDDYLKAIDYYNKGMLAEAEWSFRAVLETAPELDEGWLKLGNIYTRTNQLEAALTVYEKCVSVNPRNSRCWNNRTLVHVKQAIAVAQSGEAAFDLGSPERTQLTSLRGTLIRFLMQ